MKLLVIRVRSKGDMRLLVFYIKKTWMQIAKKDKHQKRDEGFVTISKESNFNVREYTKDKDNTIF